MGGGIRAGNASAVVENSIVAGNTAGTAPDMANVGVFPIAASFSLIGDNSGSLLVESQAADSNGNLIGSSTGGGVIDPLIGGLTDNGGQQLTLTPLAGSPVIDAGDPEFAMPASHDQRGAPFLRVSDGDGDGTARIDMGAIEVPDTLVVTTNQDDANPANFSLREAISAANSMAGPNNIIFDVSLDGNTILLKRNLPGGELAIADHLSIDASNLTLGLTINGNDPSPAINDGTGIRIFNIDDGNPASVLHVGLRRTNTYGRRHRRLRRSNSLFRKPHFGQQYRSRKLGCRNQCQRGRHL